MKGMSNDFQFPEEITNQSFSSYTSTGGPPVHHQHRQTVSLRVLVPSGLVWGGMACHGQRQNRHYYQTMEQVTGDLKSSAQLFLISFPVPPPSPLLFHPANLPLFAAGIGFAVLFVATSNLTDLFDFALWKSVCHFARRRFLCLFWMPLLCRRRTKRRRMGVVTLLLITVFCCCCGQIQSMRIRADHLQVRLICRSNGQ